MNTNENFTEQELVQAEQTQNTLNSVTPLSKYLALILFIAMPFIGGYIGYKYSPDKVVEVEKLVTVETEKEKQGSSQWYQHIEEGDFSLLVPDGYFVTSTTSGITVTDGDGYEPYTLIYKEGVESEDSATEIAKNIYGSSCEVSAKRPEESYESINEVREYYVLPPDAIAGDASEAALCHAFKVTFLYDKYQGKILTWHRGNSPALPLSENSYTDYFEEGGLFTKSYGDNTLTTSIRFEYNY